MVSWLRSLPTAESVGAFVGARYGLRVRSCVLLRSLANEVYQVAADDRRYAFKLYRHGGRPVGEVAWEQDLVAHVIGRGVPCAAPVPLPDGSPCGELDAPEGPRPFVLSEWVEGTKPQPPAGDDLFEDFGRPIGRFHAAGADFRSHHPRRPASLSAMLDEPLQAIAPMAARLDYQWHLRQVMATRGLFSTTDLIGPLADRDITLSSSQVYRLVTDRPERLSLKILMALAARSCCPPR